MLRRIVTSTRLGTYVLRDARRRNTSGSEREVGLGRSREGLRGDAPRVAFYELVTASLKAADTLGGACPAESALTPVGRMDAMRQRLSVVRAATAAIRPALARFYEALDQGQKVRFAGMS